MIKDNLHRAIYIALISILTACGGGGSGSTNPTDPVIPTDPVVPTNPTDPVVPTNPTDPVAPTNPTDPVAPTVLKVFCSGANCGAKDSNTYSGTGIGLWSYENKEQQEFLLPVNINNVNGKTATVIYTNLSTKPQQLNTVYTSANKINSVQNNLKTITETNEEKVRKFNIEGYKEFLKKNIPQSSKNNLVTVVNNAVVGDTKVWNYHETSGPTIQGTFSLVQQVSGYNGKKINFWVDFKEYGNNKVTLNDVSFLSDKFATGSDSLYKNIIDLAGEPFGTNSYSTLIPANNQTLNVVIANLKPDNKPYGQLGYFTSENNFLNSVVSNSNEALTVFLDSETIYIPVDANDKDKTIPLNLTLSTLVHEMTHLVNFYQRGILKGASFPNSWLEEVSALGMEDILSNKISTSYNAQRDNRYINYINYGEYNCAMPLFNTICDDYPRSSTFISFLNRKYGVSFYSGLLKNISSNDAVTLMDNQIKASGGIGYQDEVKKFSTNLSLLPGTNLPSGFGFPLTLTGGFTLPAIYSSDYSYYRVFPKQPTTLTENGGTYFYEVKNISNSFTQNIPVPSGTNVSIVIK